MFPCPVISVNNTQIFARISGNGTQFLAYQMTYNSEQPNAMILPLPVKQPAEEGAVRFIDLKHYETFFEDLDNGFPFYQGLGIGCAAPTKSASRSGLEVIKVGNYIASFVPTLSDFSRLDARFRLPDETWEKLPGYKDFGFAVFQLAAGSLKPHPMAFEFPTIKSDLFFPTVHVHDGAVHDSEEFDHILYMQHAGFDSRVYAYQNSYIEDKSTGLIRSKHQASHFCNVDQTAGLVDRNLLVHRKFLGGELPNTDTVIKVSGDPARPTFNFRRWLSYAPWLVMVAAIGWLFNRRSKMKANRKSKSENSADTIAT